ncbi:hypothetical protein DUNSADRAFT_136 [Dunaliella salina]|uniref:Uncharacterized protein n=1 Tax=Dunaliella salina TaxID=3046 RepID=A0ABQ7GYM8_DUNSA|nr:hypothetical protein DUNSADRAFT_136 [Dunaliella salina]|eukprot:KAF5839707.1 hypothetical protein DUNSADRAFT_136 [Dunaliella salina]
MASSMAKNNEDHESTAASRQGGELNSQGGLAAHVGEGTGAAAGRGAADFSTCMEAGVPARESVALRDNIGGSLEGAGTSEEMADGMADAARNNLAAVHAEERTTEQEQRQKQQDGQQPSPNANISSGQHDGISEDNDGRPSQEAAPDQQQQPPTPPAHPAKLLPQAKTKPTNKAVVSSSPSPSQPSGTQPPSPHSIAPHSLPHTPRSPCPGSGRKSSARAARQDQLPHMPQPLPNHSFFEGMPPPSPTSSSHAAGFTASSNSSQKQQQQQQEQQQKQQDCSSLILPSSPVWSQQGVLSTHQQKHQQQQQQQQQDFAPALQRLGPPDQTPSPSSPAWQRLGGGRVYTMSEEDEELESVSTEAKSRLSSHTGGRATIGPTPHPQPPPSPSLWQPRTPFLMAGVGSPINHAAGPCEVSEEHDAVSLWGGLALGGSSSKPGGTALIWNPASGTVLPASPAHLGSNAHSHTPPGWQQQQQQKQQHLEQLLAAGPWLPQQAAWQQHQHQQQQQQQQQQQPQQHHHQPPQAPIGHSEAELPATKLRPRAVRALSFKDAVTLPPPPPPPSQSQSPLPSSAAPLPSSAAPPSQPQLPPVTPLSTDAAPPSQSQPPSMASAPSFVEPPSQSPPSSVSDPPSQNAPKLAIRLTPPPCSSATPPSPAFVPPHPSSTPAPLSPATSAPMEAATPAAALAGITCFSVRSPTWASAPSSPAASALPLPSHTAAVNTLNPSQMVPATAEAAALASRQALPPLTAVRCPGSLPGRAAQLAPLSADATPFEGKLHTAEQEPADALLPTLPSFCSFTMPQTPSLPPCSTPIAPQSAPATPSAPRRSQADTLVSSSLHPSQQLARKSSDHEHRGDDIQWIWGLGAVQSELEDELGEERKEGGKQIVYSKVLRRAL